MCKFELSVLKWVEKHIFGITAIMVTMIALIIRYMLRFFESADYIAFLLPWYETIKANGGVEALHSQVGNYNLAYQFFICIMTYIPINPLYSYKILSVIFDFALSGMAGYIVYRFVPQNKKWNGLGAYTAAILLPPVFLNSAAWAQCDSIYTAFIIFAVYFLLKEKHIISFIFLGFAFAFKLQSVFILPLFLFVYFYRKKFSILNFMIIPVTMCITSLPGLLIGMRSVREVFDIYFKQMDYYTFMYMNYPSFWILLSDIDVAHFEMLKNLAVMVTVTLLALFMVYLLLKRVEVKAGNLIYIALLTSYTCVLFLPSMHERYDYVYLILGAILLFFNKKTLSLFIGICTISIFTYGKYLFLSTIDLKLLSIFNVILFLGYTYLFLKDLCEKGSKENNETKENNEVNENNEITAISLDE